MRKANWYRVEFLDKDTDTERYRTIKVEIAKRNPESLSQFFRRKLRGMGFRNIDILGYEITASNYLR